MVTVTLSVVLVIYVGWIGACMLKETLDRHTGWTVTSGGAFAYWTAMKLLLWIVPSVVLVRFADRSVRAVFGPGRLRSALAWGIGAGLILGVLSLAARAAMRRPLFSLVWSWPQFSVLVVAPVLEEFVFRGAVLGSLLQRYPFPLANTITAVLFLGLHLPGWYFQGRLWTNLASPVGGALAIFLLGWVFGLVAHKSKSLVASVLAHSLNNLFS